MYATRNFAGAAALAAALFAVPASAQDVFETGRFQLFQGEMAVEGGPANLPILLDTQYGRTWMLARDDDGYAWRRLNIVRQDKAPEGRIARPAPVIAPTAAR